MPGGPAPPPRDKERRTVMYEYFHISAQDLGKDGKVPVL